MNFLTRKNVLGAGLASLLSGQVFAQDTSSAFQSKQDPEGYTVVFVPEKIPLYQVASEFVRGNDNLEDGILKTNLCDDVEVRRAVSNANNAIARLTARLAGENRMDDLKAAMLLDNYMVKVKDGGKCSDEEVVNASDGLLGDGFAGLHSKSTFIPVAVPNRYIAETSADVQIEILKRDGGAPALPRADQPEAPVIPGAEAPVVRAPVPPAAAPQAVLRDVGFVGVGYHSIQETNLDNSGADLGGSGVWMDADFALAPQNRGVLVDLDKLWISGLRYADNPDENRVFVSDLDLSLLYRNQRKPSSLLLGINADGRSADVAYAGVEANTGSWAIGPEFGLRARSNPVSFDGGVSLGWGYVTSVLGDAGLVKDPLTKVKVDLDVGFPFGRLRPAFGFELENDKSNYKTEDGGELPQSDTRITPAAYLGLELGRGLEALVGVEVTDYTGPVSKTQSVRVPVGVRYNF